MVENFVDDADDCPFGQVNFYVKLLTIYFSFHLINLLTLPVGQGNKMKQNNMVIRNTFRYA